MSTAVPETKPLLAAKAGGLGEFSWSNLRYDVKNRSGSQGGRLTLLDGTVTGSVRGGEVLGIFGPSGSSKTTLLSVLSGLWRSNQGTRARLQGRIEADGTPLRHALHHLNGVYVMQDTHLNPHLTVRETIEFASRLRMQGSGRAKAVQELLKMFNLEGVAKSLCSKLSGGEKKRVYIASHLVHSPDLVILDEPTTGLDTENAATLLKCLRRMADARKAAIIVTLHQPSCLLTANLSKAMVMAEGGMVYYGDLQGIDRFLGDAGFPVPPLWLGLDYLMHVIVSGPPNGLEDSNGSLSEDGSCRGRHETVEKLKALCAKSIGDVTLDSPKGGGGSEVSTRSVRGAQYEVGVLQQIMVLGHISLLGIVRDGSSNFVPLVASNVIFGVVAATLWSDLSNTRFNYSITMALLLMILNAGLQAAALGVESAHSSFARFAMERDARLYRTSSWLIAHTLTNLPLVIFSQAVFIGISYHYLKLRESADAFAYLFGLLIMFFLLLSTIAKTIGVLSPSASMGFAVINTLQSLWIMFCGAFVTYPDIPLFWRWAYWSSPYSYALSGALVNNFRGSTEGWAHIHFMGVQIENRITHLVILGTGLGIMTLALYSSLRWKKLKYR